MLINNNKTEFKQVTVIGSCVQIGKATCSYMYFFIVKKVQFFWKTQANKWSLWKKTFKELEKQPGDVAQDNIPNSLHDNATPHSAHVTRDLIEKNFKLEPSQVRTSTIWSRLYGFHVFCQMKEALAKERFGNDERMKNAVRKRLTDVGVDFFQQWHWKTCVTVWQMSELSRWLCWKINT